MNAPAPTDFQTQTRIRMMLDAASCAPRKRYGQHFLIDGNLMRKLVDSAEIEPADCVLEVGAGTGSLTGMLSRRAGRVVAAEIDPKLAEILRGQLADMRNVRLLEGDALEGKSRLSPLLLDALRDARLESPGHLKLVANLPYDVATPLVMCLLQSDLPLARLCFTVQAEVAQRFSAAPSTGAFGIVSIVAQSWGRVSQVCKVPAAAFWPRPKVESAMVRIDPRPESGRNVRDFQALAGFVRAFFQHRRKTMSHVARGLPNPRPLLDAMNRLGIDERSRPEALSVSQWESLFAARR